jgi:serine/threonine protein kinase
MGSVWEAFLHGAFGFRKRVALKVILPEIADEAHYRKMFLDEAHVVSLLAHPNVAQVLDVGEDQGILFLVVEWVDGLTLEHLLRAGAASGDPVPLGVLLRVIADVAAGAHAAHQLRSERGEPLGIVHRDISPHNVLVGAAGLSKLIDFGIAKSSLRQATATRTGHARGKPSYLAPEQAMKFGIDHRADVWALGATLYRALHGRPPFDDVAQLVAYVYNGAAIAPLPREVPSLVEAIVTRSLEVDPMQRFASAADLRDAIEEAMIDLSLGATHADVDRFLRSVRGGSTAQDIPTPDASGAGGSAGGGTSRDGERTLEPTAHGRAEPEAEPVPGEETSR